MSSCIVLTVIFVRLTRMVRVCSLVLFPSVLKSWRRIPDSPYCRSNAVIDERVVERGDVVFDLIEWVCLINRIDSFVCVAISWCTFSYVHHGSVVHRGEIHPPPSPPPPEGFSPPPPFFRFSNRLRLEFVTSFVARRSEEHTSELQSPIRIAYAVFCLDRKSVV